jgi:hypothetical protein
VAGVGAIVAAAAVAVPTLSADHAADDPAPGAATITTARLLTVTVAQATVPLTGAELLDLLDKPAELGDLDDPMRLGSCLTGLGYSPDTAVLGGTPTEINGRPAVVLLLAADDPGLLTAFAVAPRCSAALTGLVADTTVARP